MIRISVVSAVMTMLGAGFALADTPRGKGDRAYGEYLASACVTCHLPSGQHVGGIPAITGWPDDQFVAVMQSYKNKERANAVMQTQAAALTPQDVEALAAYFGSLPGRH